MTTTIHDLDSIVELKTLDDESQVTYDLFVLDSNELDIQKAVVELDSRLALDEEKFEKTNGEVDRLTNHADSIDYSVAVACGVLSGLIDVFFVGDFDFKGSREKVGEKIDEFVKKKAGDIREKEVKKQTEEAINKAKEAAIKKGKELSEDEIERIREKFNKKLEEPFTKDKAIKYLEERFSIPSDSAYEKANENINKLIKKKIEEAKASGNPLSDEQIRDLKEKYKTKISNKTHHLDDLTHHPSVIGLAASIAQQFGSDAFFQNKEGKTIRIKVEKSKSVRKGEETVEVILVGRNLKEKLFCGVVNWLMHLISDMAGSSASAKKGNEGMGLPGPIMSLLKEVSMIPGLNKTSLPNLLNDLFTKKQDLLDDYTLDLRSELAIGKELGKQSIPVFINTLFIRCFYFVRHFTNEIKQNNGIKGLDLKKALKQSMPYKNRTVTRMLTISLGTFEAVDFGDALVRGVCNSGGTIPGFVAAFVLRINFVGIGRFTIAIGSDLSMGVQKCRFTKERMLIIQDMISANEAKMYYKSANVRLAQMRMYDAMAENYEEEAELWKQVKGTEESFIELENDLVKLASEYHIRIEEINKSFQSIENDLAEIRGNNPGLIDDLLNRLN